ncbi:Gfo/Idh/MocA family protein [Lysobacter korlensis]|uniref:Gfo/Idh/MocA family protein n=1 Tax=Lysobacter korlensis TaxID=553636 RepID=A0ABV6RX29_9GAMM
MPNSSAPHDREAPPLRWAVIGTGDISHRLGPDLQAIGGTVVTAVWGRRMESATAFAAAHGIPHASADLTEVLERDDVDAVYLATPIATHLPLGLQALSAGKHLLVEKPMAVSAADAEQLFDAAERANRFVMEAMWMKFNPLHAQLTERIRDGLIGEPRSVRAGFGTPFPAGGSRWSAELGGSTVLDQGIYAITLAQSLLGEPVAITARGRVRDGVDVHAVIDLEFADGRFAQLAASAVEFIDPSAAVSGSGGWLTIDRMFWASTAASLYTAGIPSLFTPPERLELERQGNGFVPMLNAVVRAIGAGRRTHPRHDRRATLSVARTMDAVRAQILSAGVPG